MLCCRRRPRNHQKQIYRRNCSGRVNYRFDWGKDAGRGDGQVLIAQEPQYWRLATRSGSSVSCI
jgi:hypothetical protein